MNDNILVNNIDYNIALLKIVMCVEVVFTHCYINDGFFSVSFLKFLASYHVPSFMFISFYLWGKKEFSSKFLINKIERIVYPLFFWGGGIAWVVYSIINREFCLKALFCKIVFGSYAGYYNNQLWYSFDLLVITIIIGLVLLIIKSNFMIYLTLTAIISIYVQYSSINIYIYHNIYDAIKFPIGRIIEMYPYAVLGIIFSKNENRTNTTRNKLIVCLICIVAIYISRGIVIGYPAVTFYYGGIDLFLQSIIVILLFLNIPMEIFPNRIKDIIWKLSKFAPGIYYCHLLVYKLLLSILEKIDYLNSTFECSVIVIILSILLVYIFNKSKIKILRKAVQ